MRPPTFHQAADAAPTAGRVMGAFAPVQHPVGQRASGWYAGTPLRGAMAGGVAILRPVPAGPGKAACGGDSRLKGGRDGAEPFYTEGCGCGGGCGGALNPMPAPAGVEDAASAPDARHAGEFTPASVVGPVVDIYLSSGVHASSGTSCDSNNQGNCGLYRVRWDIGARRATEVEHLAGTTYGPGYTYGNVEPAVNSRGDVAFIQRAYATSSGGTSGAEHSASLRLLRAGGSTTTELDSGVHSQDRPQWPWFAEDDRVVYEKVRNTTVEGLQGEWRTLWSVQTDGGHPSPRIGVDGVGNQNLPVSEQLSSGLFREFPFVSTRNISYGNPQVFTTAGGDSRLLTFGLGPDSRLYSDPTLGPRFVPWPHETALDGTDRRPFLSDDANLVSCQHPAWSRDGQRVMCTQHEEEVMVTFPDGTGARSKPLRVFNQDDEIGWKDAGLLFDRTRRLPPAFDRKSYHTLVFKFAHWCGDDDHVVATVYCTEGTSHTSAQSRVLLIDLTGRHAHQDLTAIVAKHFPWLGDAAHWRGIFSVCRDVA